ncbi:hypothetical protein J7L67_07475 [bacterium]|nr:hypothetical protein [bacterium]
MKRPYRIIIVILALIFIVSVNMNLMPVINKARLEANLTRNNPLDNAPPQFVLAVNMLGGLRCLLIDMLWLRTMKLREEGKYFEMTQLYKWICELEPQIEDVWTHNAWNMAYNISFEMPYAPDRWRWIKAAIAMLRDEALKYNSKSAVIRKEIAWIYSHKIGQQWDDMHAYYKKQLALEMEQVIQTPDDIREMNKLPPINEALKNDKPLNDLYNQIKKQKFKSFSDTKNYLRKLSGEENINQDSLEKIRLLLSKEELKNNYKLNIPDMVYLMDKFGNLDWRLPDTHALYWAYEGKKYADVKSYIFYDRLIYMSLQSIYRRGSLYLVKQGDDVLYVTGPAKEFIKPMNKLYEEMFARYKNKPAMKNILSSYRYFLQEIIVLYFIYDDKTNSEKFFKIYAQKFPEHLGNMSYSQFVLKEFKETAATGNFEQIQGLIYSLIKQAYWNLALEENKLFEGYMRLAQILWNEYTISTGKSNRLKLPPFEIIKKKALDNALNAEFPRSIRKLLKTKVN